MKAYDGQMRLKGYLGRLFFHPNVQQLLSELFSGLLNDQFYVDYVPVASFNL